MRGTRLIAVTAALLLAALVAGAATLADSGPSAARIVPSHLQAGPGPLRTATGVLAYSDSTGLSMTATCAFDFVHGTADITANAQLSIATIDVEARLVGATLLLNTASLQSLTGSPWVSVPAQRASAGLERLERTLRHPDLAALRKANRATVSTTGRTSTTTMWFNHVTLPSTSGLPITLPSEGRLVLVVTTGSEGQLLVATAHLSNSSEDVHFSLHMTGYNQPVEVAVPSSADVVALTPSRARQIFGTNAPAVLHWLRRAGTTIP